MKICIRETSMKKRFKDTKRWRKGRRVREGGSGEKGDEKLKR